MKFSNTAKFIIPIVLLIYACKESNKEKNIYSKKAKIERDISIDEEKINSTDLTSDIDKDFLMWKVLNSYGADTLALNIIEFGNNKYLQDKTQLFIDSLLQISPKHYTGNELNKIQEKILQINNNTNTNDLFEVKNSLISYVNLSDDFYSVILQGSDLSDDFYSLITYDKGGVKIDESNIGGGAIEGAQIDFKFYPNYIKIINAEPTDLYDIDDKQIYDVTMKELFRINDDGEIKNVKTPDSIVTKYKTNNVSIKQQKIVGTYKFGKNIETENCGEILIKPCSINSVYIYHSISKAAPSYQTKSLLTEIKIEDNISYYQDSLGNLKYEYEFKNDSIFISGIGPFIKTSNKTPKIYIQGNGKHVPISKQVNSFRINYY